MRMWKLRYTMRARRGKSAVCAGLERKNRDQGTGIGNREQGTGIRDQGTGIREQGTGIRDQEQGSQFTEPACFSESLIGISNSRLLPRPAI